MSEERKISEGAGRENLSFKPKTKISTTLKSGKPGLDSNHRHSASNNIIKGREDKSTFEQLEQSGASRGPLTKIAMGSIQIQPLNGGGVQTQPGPASAKSSLASQKPSIRIASGKDSPLQEGSGSSEFRLSQQGLQTVKQKKERAASNMLANTHLPLPTSFDIGRYDGSLERDERRGRRTGEFAGGPLDFDAQK